MSQLSHTELDEIYAFAVQLCKDAGQMLLEVAELRYADDRTEELGHVEKDSSVDLVTQTDEGTMHSKEPRQPHQD